MFLGTCWVWSGYIDCLSQDVHEEMCILHLYCFLNISIIRKNNINVYCEMYNAVPVWPVLQSSV